MGTCFNDAGTRKAYGNHGYCGFDILSWFAADVFFIQFDNTV